MKYTVLEAVLKDENAWTKTRISVPAFFKYKENGGGKRQMLRRWIYSLYLQEEGHLFTSDNLSLVTF